MTNAKAPNTMSPPNKYQPGNIVFGLDETSGSLVGCPCISVRTPEPPSVFFRRGNRVLPRFFHTCVKKRSQISTQNLLCHDAKRGQGMGRKQFLF